MMKSLLHLREPIQFGSVLWKDSTTFEGVRFAIRRVSLLQRIQLTKSIRELMHRDEFLRAGDLSDQLEAGLAELLVKKLYIEWGLAAIEGLNIDGKPASTEALLQAGPESLTEEIASSIQAELGLSEEERKNF